MKINTGPVSLLVLGIRKGLVHFRAFRAWFWFNLSFYHGWDYTSFRQCVKFEQVFQKIRDSGTLKDIEDIFGNKIPEGTDE